MPTVVESEKEEKKGKGGWILSRAVLCGAVLCCALHCHVMQTKSSVRGDRQMDGDVDETRRERFCSGKDTSLAGNKK